MSMFRMLATLLLMLAPLATAAAADPAAAMVRGGPRVRPNDGRSAGLLLEGIARSASIRRIADELEQYDVIVYIGMQPALRGRMAGSLTWMTRAGKFRYVRVSLNPDAQGDAAVALLGHELQHALEVAREPSVIDARSLEDLYRRIGHSIGVDRSGWDTYAARQVGDEVRRELTSSGRVVIESIQQFDPLEWHVVYRRARERMR